jgi:hypothetical protein
MVWLFLAILGFELKVSHLLGRYSIALVILEIESCFFAQVGLDHDPPALCFLL